MDELVEGGVDLAGHFNVLLTPLLVLLLVAQVKAANVAGFLGVAFMQGFLLELVQLVALAASFADPVGLPSQRVAQARAKASALVICVHFA